VPLPLTAVSLSLRTLRHLLLAFVVCLGLRAEVQAEDPLLKDFQSTYRRIVQEALNGSASDAQFWANANKVVFGVREPTTDSAAARRIFEQKLFKLDLGSDKDEVPEIYEADTPQGAKMEQRLQELLVRLKDKNPVSVEDLLELGDAAGPFLRALELGARGPVLEVPAKTEVTIRTRPFCLQHNAPAAPGNAAMWLIPSDTLLPKQARPIVKALSVHVSSHPGDHGIVQSLLWAIRHADTQPLASLSKEQERVLNASLKDGARLFLEYIASVRSGSSNKTASTKGKAPSSKPAEVDDFGNPVEGGSTLDLGAAKQDLIDENLDRAGIQHTGNPLNEADVESIMRQLVEAGARQLDAGGSSRSPQVANTDGFNSLEADASSLTGPAGPTKTPARKDSANDACTLLEKQVAAELHTLNMGESTLRIANAGDRPYRYDFSEHVGLARMVSQPALLTPPVCQAPSENTLKKAEKFVKDVGTFLTEKDKEGALPLQLLHALFPALAENRFSSTVVQELIKAVPVVGDLISLTEVATGKDFFTGKEISGVQRAVQLVSVPFMACKAIKNCAKLAELISAYKVSQGAVKFAEHREMFEALSAFAGKGKDLLEKGIGSKWISQNTVEAVGDVSDIVEPLIKLEGGDFGEAATRVATRRTLKGLTEHQTKNRSR